VNAVGSGEAHCS